MVPTSTLPRSPDFEHRDLSSRNVFAHWNLINHTVLTYDIDPSQGTHAFGTENQTLRVLEPFFCLKHL